MDYTETNTVCMTVNGLNWTATLEVMIFMQSNFQWQTFTDIPNKLAGNFLMSPLCFTVFIKEPLMKADELWQNIGKIRFVPGCLCRFAIWTDTDCMSMNGLRWPAIVCNCMAISNGLFWADTVCMAMNRLYWTAIAFVALNEYHYWTATVWLSYSLYSNIWVILNKYSSV